MIKNDELPPSTTGVENLFPWKEKGIKREEEETGRDSIQWSTPQMPALVRDGPWSKKEPEKLSMSLKHVAGI